MTGYSLVAIDALFRLPKGKYELADTRLDICRACGFSTWMTATEYKQWIVDNGGVVKFASEIDHLDQWSLLPKQKYARGRKLFCRACKCWLPAKAYLQNEKCTKEKW